MAGDWRYDRQALLLPRVEIAIMAWALIMGVAFDVGFGCSLLIGDSLEGRKHLIECDSEGLEKALSLTVLRGGTQRDGFVLDDIAYAEAI